MHIHLFIEKGSSLKTSWEEEDEWKNNNYVDGLKITSKLRYLSDTSAL